MSLCKAETQPRHTKRPRDNPVSFGVLEVKAGLYEGGQVGHHGSFTCPSRPLSF